MAFQFVLEILKSDMTKNIYCWKYSLHKLFNCAIAELDGLQWETVDRYTANGKRFHDLKLYKVMTLET